jgi:hypothetical protein
MTPADDTDVRFLPNCRGQAGFRPVRCQCREAPSRLGAIRAAEDRRAVCDGHRDPVMIPVGRVHAVAHEIPNNPVDNRHRTEVLRACSRFLKQAAFCWVVRPRLASSNRDRFPALDGNDNIHGAASGAEPSRRWAGKGAVKESPRRGSASTRPNGQPLLSVHQRQRIDLRLQHWGARSFCLAPPRQAQSLPDQLLLPAVLASWGFSHSRTRTGMMDSRGVS